MRKRQFPSRERSFGLPMPVLVSTEQAGNKAIGGRGQPLGFSEVSIRDERYELVEEKGRGNPSQLRRIIQRRAITDNIGSPSD